MGNELPRSSVTWVLLLIEHSHTVIENRTWYTPRSDSRRQPGPSRPSREALSAFQKLAGSFPETPPGHFGKQARGISKRYGVALGRASASIRTGLPCKGLRSFTDNSGATFAERGNSGDWRLRVILK
jgi:hypothetical protein